MIAILWSLLGATTYGVSDFIGAIATRRSSAWPVALATSVGATASTALLALAVHGSPSASDYGWATLAGIGGGVGIAFLYRGLGRGRMGVVAPTSAVGAAALPVVVSTVFGEHPPALAWVGILVALPGIWLVSSEEGTALGGPGLVDGLVAGVGFGINFIGLGHIGESAGWWPLTVMNVASAAAVVLVATCLRQRVVSREPVVYLGLVGGLLAASAMVAFLVATRHGLVSIAAVLVSLYPAVTIALAVAFLHERIQRVQRIGLALCALAVALVALSGRG
ncbi:MAG: EamA family transporter [Marmoricola sp.]